MTDNITELKTKEAKQKDTASEAIQLILEDGGPYLFVTADGRMVLDGTTSELLFIIERFKQQLMTGQLAYMQQED
jgi:hypothetical protein